MIHPATRHRWAKRWNTWQGWLLEQVSRTGLLVLEMVAFSPVKKAAIRQQRQQFDNYDALWKVTLNKIRSGQVQDGYEEFHASLSLRGATEAQREQMRRIIQENEDMKAIRQAANGDWEKAIREIEEYIRKHPDSAGAYTWLGGTLRKAKRYPEAREAYQVVLRLEDETSLLGASACQSIGEIFLIEGKATEAVSLMLDQTEMLLRLGKGLKIKKYIAPAYLILDLAFRQLGNAEAAENAQREAERWKIPIPEGYDKGR